MRRVEHLRAQEKKREHRKEVLESITRLCEALRAKKHNDKGARGDDGIEGKEDDMINAVAGSKLITPLHEVCQWKMPLADSNGNDEYVPDCITAEGKERVEEGYDTSDNDRDEELEGEQCEIEEEGEGEGEKDYRVKDLKRMNSDTDLGAEVVRVLLKYGADPCALTSSGESPLMTACALGNHHIVELLLGQLSLPRDHYALSRSGKTPASPYALPR